MCGDERASICEHGGESSRCCSDEERVQQHRSAAQRASAFRRAKLRSAPGVLKLDKGEGRGARGQLDADAQDASELLREREQAGGEREME